MRMQHGVPALEQMKGENGFSTREAGSRPLWSRKPGAERRLSPELLGNIMLLAPSQEPATSFSEQAAGQKGPVEAPQAGPMQARFYPYDYNGG